MNLTIIDDPPIDINIISEDVGITSNNPIPIELYSTHLTLDPAPLDDPVEVSLPNPSDYIEGNEVGITELDINWPIPLLLNITNYNNTALQITDVNFTEITASNIATITPITITSAITVFDSNFTTITPTPSSIPDKIKVNLQNTTDTLPVSLFSTILDAINFPQLLYVTIGSNGNVSNQLDVIFEPDAVEIENPPSIITIFNGSNPADLLPVNLTLGELNLLNFPETLNISQTEKVNVLIDPAEIGIASLPSLVNVNIASINANTNLNIINELGNKLITKETVDNAIERLDYLKIKSPLSETFLSNLYHVYKSKYLYTDAVPESYSSNTTVNAKGISVVSGQSFDVSLDFQIYTGGKTIYTFAYNINYSPINYDARQRITCFLFGGNTNVSIQFYNKADADTYDLFIAYSTESSTSNTFFDSNSIFQSSFNIDKLDGTGESGLDLNIIKKEPNDIIFWILKDNDLFTFGIVYDSIYYPLHVLTFFSEDLEFTKLEKISPLFRKSYTFGNEPQGFTFTGYNVYKNIPIDHVTRKLKTLEIDLNVQTNIIYGGPTPCIKMYKIDPSELYIIDKIQITSSSNIKVRLHISKRDIFNVGPIYGTIGSFNWYVGDGLVDTDPSLEWDYTFYSGFAFSNLVSTIKVSDYLKWTQLTNNNDILLSIEDINNPTATVQGKVLINVLHN